MYLIYSTPFFSNYYVLVTGHNAQNSTNIISIFMKINIELFKKDRVNNIKLVLRHRNLLSSLKTELLIKIQQRVL